MKRCPIYTCSRNVAPKQVMCPDHWEKVPVSLRESIRSLKRTPDSEAFKAACLAAVNHVSEEESLQREMDNYVSSMR